MGMKSDCCGAETCDHCYDCGSYNIRPKCDKCDEFCERKPAEPREACAHLAPGYVDNEGFGRCSRCNDKYSMEWVRGTGYVSKLGCGLSDDPDVCYCSDEGCASFKQNHPGRWPVDLNAIEGLLIHFCSNDREEQEAFREKLESVRDYILQLEARVKELEGK